MDVLLRRVVLNVNISSREIFLLSHASSVIIPVLWVFSEMVKLTNIQASEAAHILGAGVNAGQRTPTVYC